VPLDLDGAPARYDAGSAGGNSHARSAAVPSGAQRATTVIRPVSDSMLDAAGGLG
jgi:hypothetical protein